MVRLQPRKGKQEAGEQALTEEDFASAPADDWGEGAGCGEKELHERRRVRGVERLRHEEGILLAETTPRRSEGTL